jgi:hypothetical protein
MPSLEIPLQGAPRGRGGRDFAADRQSVEQRRAALEGGAKWGHDRFEGGSEGGRPKKDPRNPTYLGTKMCVGGKTSPLGGACCLGVYSQ